MAKLGTKKRPAVVHVQNPDRAEEIIELCNEYGWQVVVGIEPDEEEDITDVNRLLHPPKPVQSSSIVGRNDPCPCGSGRKYKKCCG